MDLNPIEKLIGKYEYSKSDLLLKEDLKIFYDPRLRLAYIPDFYDYTGESTKGTCTELGIKFYKELKDYFRELHILRAYGTEPKIFRGSSNHFFLIISEDDIMEGAKEMEFDLAMKCLFKNLLLKKEVAVADPCFGIVRPILESSYGVTRMVNQKASDFYPVDDILFEGITTPLYISGSGNLVCLYVDFGEDDFLGIVSHGPQETIYNYPLSSKELTREAREDSQLSNFLELFRGAQIIEHDIDPESLKKIYIA